VAEGIAVRKPARLRQIQEAIKQTGGQLYLVSEEAIGQSREMAGKQGLYVEFTTAAALAAIPQSQESGRILIPLTGHGLKNN
jgi:threonine synthase